MPRVCVIFIGRFRSLFSPLSIPEFFLPFSCICLWFPVVFCPYFKASADQIYTCLSWFLFLLILCWFSSFWRALVRALSHRGCPRLSHNLSIFFIFDLDFPIFRRHDFDFWCWIRIRFRILVPQFGSADSAVRCTVRGSPPRPTSLQTSFVWFDSYENQILLLIVDIPILRGTKRSVKEQGGSAASAVA